MVDGQVEWTISQTKSSSQDSSFGFVCCAIWSLIQSKPLLAFRSATKPNHQKSVICHYRFIKASGTPCYFCSSSSCTLIFVICFLLLITKHDLKKICKIASRFPNGARVNQRVSKDRTGSNETQSKLRQKMNEVGGSKERCVFCETCWLKAKSSKYYWLCKNLAMSRLYLD